MFLSVYQNNYLSGGLCMQITLKDLFQRTIDLHYPEIVYISSILRITLLQAKCSTAG